MEPLKVNTQRHTQLLIKSVKNKPALYDTTARDYHDRALKKPLWDEVVSEVYSQKTYNAMSKADKLYYAREIQRRWSSLRHCFRRELNLQKKANSVTFKTHKRRKKYEYFEHLLFLSPFTEDGDVASSPKYDPDTEPVEVLVEIDELDYGSSEIDVKDETEAKVRKTDEEPQSNVSNDEIEYVNVDTRLSLNDDDEAFFLSLIPTMKEFTIDQKMLLRIEIMKTIVSFKNTHGL